MARPKKSDPRDKQLNLSLTASEYESVVQRAQALGMRPVHYGRAMVLTTEHPAAAKPAPTSNLHRLMLVQLSRLGNNLNQMMRHLYQTGDPPPNDLEPLLNDIRQLIRKASK